MFGGYFFLYPMTLVLLALPRVRHGLKAKGLMPLWICAVCVAEVLCIFDLQGAGILMRYICDFGLYFALAAALSFWSFCRCARASRCRRAGPRSWAPMRRCPCSRRARMRWRRPPWRGQTVSVYRIALYFMFGSLVLMIGANVLLWNAFGIY